MNTIEVGDIKTLFGDRVLVERLGKPNMTRGLYVPESYKENKKDRSQIWWGIIAKFGLDSHIKEDHGLSEGDIIGIDSLARDCTSFKDSKGTEFVWVPDEFVAIVDQGAIRGLYAGC